MRVCGDNEGFVGAAGAPKTTKKKKKKKQAYGHRSRAAAPEHKRISTITKKEEMGWRGGGDTRGVGCVMHGAAGMSIG